MLASVRKLTEEDEVIALVTGLGDAALALSNDILGV
jgi:glycerate-2-kinase